ncbi:MAG: hypothetical protein ACTSWG_03175 [Candidatus Helarchaeota archaeon]
MAEQVKKAEFKINIQDTPKEYLDGLILGLIYSGYDVYFDYEKKYVCFIGWKDEIIKEIK